MLQAYLNYISNLDSISLRQIYNYIRYIRGTNILNIIFNIFNKQILQITILAIFNKQAKQTFSILLVYRNYNITLL